MCDFYTVVFSLPPYFFIFSSYIHLFKGFFPGVFTVFYIVVLNFIFFTYIYFILYFCMSPEAKAYRKQLGKNIRSLRALYGHTQKVMAAHLQMSIANYSNIENGYINIDTFKLNQLAVFFSMKETDIIHFHKHPIFESSITK